MLLNAIVQTIAGLVGGLAVGTTVKEHINNKRVWRT
jgi:hypothetical protein